MTLTKPREAPGRTQVPAGVAGASRPRSPQGARLPQSVDGFGGSRVPSCDLDAAVREIDRLVGRYGARRERDALGLLSAVLEDVTGHGGAASWMASRCACCGCRCFDGVELAGVAVCGRCFMRGLSEAMHRALSPADPKTRHATEDEQAEAALDETSCLKAENGHRKCDDWRAWVCSCKGRCRCHWRKRTDDGR